MNYFIIAGEASGDLHGSELVKALKKQNPDAGFKGWGGDLMAKEGVEISQHYKSASFMGFKEVISNLPAIFRNLKRCKREIAASKPDAVILIDYPGFNLRIAEFTKKAGIKTIYYISPQVWAWKASRVEKIKKYVDLMLVILPFEKAFYEKYNYPVSFVGHPLLDVIDAYRTDLPEAFRKKHGLDEREIVAILPGSRKQEIKKKLPVMSALQDDFKDYQFVVAGAPGIDEAFYEPYIAKYSIKVIRDDTLALLANAKAALVTSGTATLETALMGVPEVVCYKGSKISFWIGRMLVNIKYISLVNLIMDQEVVKELIQSELNVRSLRQELNKLLNDESYVEEMKANYHLLRKKLGGAGASERAAKEIDKFIKQKD
jgi:lipid-A-disaccharide synthase